MPYFEVMDLYQAAVLWPFAGYDAYGQPAVGEPVELRVRWLTKRTEALDPQGNTITLDGQAVVAQDVAVGSLMWLGELADWYGTGSDATDSELMEVKSFDSAPDIKNRGVRRTVGLMRYHAAHPPSPRSTGFDGSTNFDG